MTKLPLTLALLLSSVAYGDDDPEFLLDAYGARVDLPARWTGTPGSWTNEAFEASADGGKLLFFSWGTDFQSELTDDSLDAWKQVMVDKALARRMSEAKVVAAEVKKVGKRRVALFDLEVSASGGSGLMFGASEAVDGHVFHMMVMSGKRKGRAGRAARDAFVDRLDVVAPAADLEWGGAVAAAGFSSDLPKDWRPMLETELDDFKPLVRDLGLTALDECWMAVRPRGPDKPDVMVGCASPIWLGVVDEYSFEGVEAELREKLFGAAPIAPAQQRPAGDRLGFAYGADLGSRAMAVGVVPYDQGVFRIWAVGSENLSGGVDEVLAGAQLSGPHPADMGATVSYYLGYRPFSPMVLGPAGLLLLLIGGGVGGGLMMMGGKKSKYDFDDEDDLD
ncbi:MAG: hypothetical protein KC912_25600 [Proteobacteria bacterium]|nr:hypothetical protein [Pseudomonadota bacterium]